MKHGGRIGEAPAGWILMNKRFELTETILGCCYDVATELGIGFLELVYKKALAMALRDVGLNISEEKRYEVFFRGKIIGTYIADLVVEEQVIVEVKGCQVLLPEHQAQLINYLYRS